jgi:divalent metal cation (Fe/Co/Zn/Cd) transporter
VGLDDRRSRDCYARCRDNQDIQAIVVRPWPAPRKLVQTLCQSSEEQIVVILDVRLVIRPLQVRYTMDADRDPLVRRGIRLNYLTIGYNTVEAIVSLAAGIVAGSVALVSFGVDSAIEVTSAGAAQFRLRADSDPVLRERSEHWTHRLVGASFLLLAAYVLMDAGPSLLLSDPPESSKVGIAILALSVVVMPLLARAKRKVAVGLGSGTLAADAAQTSLCAYLSVIALAGVGLNALLGWWWADPVAAIAMLPIIVKEGVDGVRGRSSCTDGCKS